ncbi:MAG: hypothetical protein ACU0BS_12345 [Hasllibacter sp.]
MRIIDATITEARHDDHLARAEAVVHLKWQPVLGGPTLERDVRASAPLDDPKGRDLRTRLVAGALTAMTGGAAAAA